MHWSKLNKDPNHLAEYQTVYRDIGWRINRVGASLLAIVSLVTIFINFLNEYEYSIGKFSPIAWIELMSSIILCGLVIYINRKAYSNGPKSSKIIKTLDASIKDFYDKCCDETIASQKYKQKQTS